MSELPTARLRVIERPSAPTHHMRAAPVLLNHSRTPRTLVPSSHPRRFPEQTVSNVRARFPRVPFLSARHARPPRASRTSRHRRHRSAPARLSAAEHPAQSFRRAPASARARRRDRLHRLKLRRRPDKPPTADGAAVHPILALCTPFLPLAVQLGLELRIVQHDTQQLDLHHIRRAAPHVVPLRMYAHQGLVAAFRREERKAVI